MFCVSWFQGSLLVIVIMIDGGKKSAFVKAAFELQRSLLFDKPSNVHYHVYAKEGLYAIYKG